MKWDHEKKNSQTGELKLNNCWVFIRCTLQTVDGTEEEETEKQQMKGGGGEGEGGWKDEQWNNERWRNQAMKGWGIKGWVWRVEGVRGKWMRGEGKEEGWRVEQWKGDWPIDEGWSSARMKNEAFRRETRVPVWREGLGRGKGLKGWSGEGKRGKTAV